MKVTFSRTEYTIGRARAQYMKRKRSNKSLPPRIRKLKNIKLAYGVDTHDTTTRSRRFKRANKLKSSQASADGVNTHYATIRNRGETVEQLWRRLFDSEPRIDDALFKAQKDFLDQYYKGGHLYFRPSEQFTAVQQPRAQIEPHYLCHHDSCMRVREWLDTLDSDPKMMHAYQGSKSPKGALWDSANTLVTSDGGAPRAKSVTSSTTSSTISSTISSMISDGPIWKSPIPDLKATFDPAYDIEAIVREHRRQQENLIVMMQRRQSDALPSASEGQPQSDSPTQRRRSDPQLPAPEGQPQPGSQTQATQAPTRDRTPPPAYPIARLSAWKPPQQNASQAPQQNDITPHQQSSSLSPHQYGFLSSQPTNPHVGQFQPQQNFIPPLHQCGSSSSVLTNPYANVPYAHAGQLQPQDAYLGYSYMPINVSPAPPPTQESNQPHSLTQLTNLPLRGSRQDQQRPLNPTGGQQHHNSNSQRIQDWMGGMGQSPIPPRSTIQVPPPLPTYSQWKAQRKNQEQQQQQQQQQTQTPFPQPTYGIYTGAQLPTQLQNQHHQYTHHPPTYNQSQAWSQNMRDANWYPPAPPQMQSQHQHPQQFPFPLSHPLPPTALNPEAPEFVPRAPANQRQRPFDHQRDLRAPGAVNDLCQRLEEERKREEQRQSEERERLRQQGQQEEEDAEAAQPPPQARETRAATPLWRRGARPLGELSGEDIERQRRDDDRAGH